jgi:hypothetical protein
MIDPEEGRVRILEGALAGMGLRPTPLEADIVHRSRWEDPVARIASTEQLLDLLRAGDVNSPLRRALMRRLREWDYANTLGDSEKNTPERRAEIYQLLAIPDAFAAWCTENVPMWQPAEPLVVIGADHVDWYHPEVPGTERFYWKRYTGHLESVGSWEPESILDLDQSTTAVVERLANPLSAEARQTKGLVAGHVQSGKTANFTGVVAKAADAGYRLFIILAGTLDILRNQTQRRLDRELIGRELLEHEYEDDDDWPNGFLAHGARPSALDAFDWERLTRRFEDYQSLDAGIAALRFHKSVPGMPLYAPENLRREPARLLVIKKNRRILERVAGDLRRISETIPLSEIPTLIIDDESDQASLNTRKPTPTQARQRTAINGAIIELLRVLPRAQYLGYTATPFANVFVDPDDVDDLFPADYLVPLPRPGHYMGASDFHDLEGDRSGDGFASNERAFVRDVRGVDGAPQNLPAAIDAFVLSGAVKLWREERLGLGFRHHTMLVHVSQRRDAQRAMAARLDELWAAAGHDAMGGMQRLRVLWEADYLPVLRARSEAGTIPTGFDELIPHVGRCIARVEEGGKRILIVNSDALSDDPDFDRERVWKILVGGAKLSRGYTVEGLTVSYYRRRAEAMDTLMQMGRWFGFRRGYGDLVRLYIGRAEPLPKGQGTIDLYLAFEGACRDEMDFRRELQKYALPKYGGQGLRPAQVPPLVSAHVLRPTATNKMYNAKINFQNFSAGSTQSTMAPAGAQQMNANQEAARILLRAAAPTREVMEYTLAGTRESFDAFVGPVSHEVGLEFLRSYRWIDDAPLMQRQIDFLTGREPTETRVLRWLVLAPQISNDLPLWRCDGLSLSVMRRARAQTGGRYKVYSTPRDITLAQALLGRRDDVALVGAATRWASPDQAILLLYPARDVARGEGEDFVTLGFALEFPRNEIPVRISFGVREPTRPDAIVVDRQ